MTIEKQFSKGVAWMAVGNWVEQAVNLAVFVALARLLGAEDFGLVAMAVTFVILAEALVRETVSEVLIAEKALSDAHFTTMPEWSKRLDWTQMHHQRRGPN